MTWARVDDQFPDHPKIAALSDRAFRVHVKGICYANRLLTDGFIPRSVGQQWGRGTAELVQRGIWREKADGFTIHDWLDWNQSKAQVLAARAAKAKGGHAAQQKLKQMLSTTSSESSAMASPAPTPENPEQERPTHTFTKYLDRFHDSERSFRGVTAERLLEIAGEEGIEAETAGKLLADVWEWWQTVPPSKRWKIPTRGWRGWCRREVKFAKEAAAKALAVTNGKPAPPPPLTAEERMAKREASWQVDDFEVSVP